MGPATVWLVGTAFKTKKNLAISFVLIVTLVPFVLSMEKEPKGSNVKAHHRAFFFCLPKTGESIFTE